jgi:hypothetical protein
VTPAELAADCPRPIESRYSEASVAWFRRNPSQANQ